jgi:hypothetical protein
MYGPNRPRRYNRPKLPRYFRSRKISSYSVEQLCEILAQPDSLSRDEEQALMNAYNRKISRLLKKSS